MSLLLVPEPDKMQQDRVQMKEIKRKIGNREPVSVPHGKRIGPCSGGARG